MNYPEDFDTSAFPVGRRIVLSRTAGIWGMVTLFLVVCLCVLIMWIKQNRRINPFIIYVNGPQGHWESISNDKTELSAPYWKSVQRSLVGIFTEKWFTISNDPNYNEKMWSRCTRKDTCFQQINNTFVSGCDIYCMASDDMFHTFSTKVLPQYKEFTDMGQVWRTSPTNIIVVPDGVITEAGGDWIVTARIRSNLNGDFDIIAYVNVKHDTELYPQTLGYYISQFNAYRK